MKNFCIKVDGKFMCDAATSFHYCKFFAYPKSINKWWCEFANAFEDQTCSCIEAQLRSSAGGLMKNFCRVDDRGGERDFLCDAGISAHSCKFNQHFDSNHWWCDFVDNYSYCCKCEDAQKESLYELALEEL